MFKEYSISIAQIQPPSLQHLYYPCLFSTPYLFHISSQYTISPAHIQAVHYLSISAVSKLSLLSMPNENITSLSINSQNSRSSAHVKPAYHLGCSCSISTPSLLLSFYKNSTSPVQVQPIHHPSNILSIQSNSSAHVQSVHHLTCPYTGSTRSFHLCSQ